MFQFPRFLWFTYSLYLSANTLCRIVKTFAIPMLLLCVIWGDAMVSDAQEWGGEDETARLRGRATNTSRVTVENSQNIAENLGDGNALYPSVDGAIRFRNVTDLLFRENRENYFWGRDGLQNRWASLAERRTPLWPDWNSFRWPFTQNDVADISDPGPDSPDFPDSSRCVPPGVVYVENAIVYRQFSYPVQSHARLAISELIRFGMWKDFEFRLSGSPFVYQEVPAHTGMSPITLGFKQNLVKEDSDKFLPGWGLEGGIAVPVGPSFFGNDDRWLPYLSLNMDQQLPWDVALNMSFIPNWQIGDNNEVFVQTIIQWSFSREFDFLDNVEFFQHGYVGLPGNNGYSGNTQVIGFGYIWYATKKMAIDSSYNLGTSSEVQKHGGRVGLSLAY